MCASPIPVKGNIITRTNALQRVLLSAAVAVLVFFLIRNGHPGFALGGTALWVAFAFTFVLFSWIIFFNMPVEQIKHNANKEDGSRFFVMVIVLISCFASLSMVLMLMLNASKSDDNHAMAIVLAVAGMMLSWVMVHTIFTFHYARLYYFDDVDDTGDEEALDFPGGKQPDYLDFAYYSFVIGMTFQVSDVDINSRILRRTTLFHSLLSFALNTFVVALTINLIAGLR